MIAIVFCLRSTSPHVRATASPKRIPVEISKEDAIAAGRKALEDAGKLSGTVVKEIYVPGKIINIVAKP